jgi:hypothetical protein
MPRFWEWKYFDKKVLNLFIKVVFYIKLLDDEALNFDKIKEINNNKKFLIKITLLILNWLYKIAFNYRVG